MKSNNTPNVSDLARWIDLQLSTIIDGVSAGYTLGNYNSVWIDKGATMFNVSLANGETVEIDSDNYNTAEEIATAIISTLKNTPTAMDEKETNEFSELTHAGQCLDIYLNNTSDIYDRYTVPAIGACVKAQTIKAPGMWEYIKQALQAAARLVIKYDGISPTADDIKAVTSNYVAYITECAEYNAKNA